MVNIISDYIPPFSPLSNIAPFSYKDGETYLSTLEYLRKYFNETVVSFVNENFTALGDSFTTEVNTLIDQVENRLTEQNSINDGKIADVDTAIANFIITVNNAIDSVVNSSIEVSEPIVNQIFSNAASTVRTLLDSLYANANTAEIVNNGRLSQVTLDSDYANIDIAEIVNNGRLSQTNLDSTINDAVLNVSGQLNVDLVAKLQTPLYVSHRGGYSVYPEHSMEGYRASVASGFIIEQDISVLSDGTLVCIHDTTIDRVMVSGTGNVSAINKSQWLNLRIKPAILGSLRANKTAMPVLWEDVINEFGGRTVLMPEIKVNDPAVTAAVIDSIVKRSLQKSVIIQSFIYSDCLLAVASGISALFLSDIANPQTLAADGVKFVGVTVNATDNYISSLVSAGLKPIVFTPATRGAANAQFNRGAFGVFSDDVWGMTGRYPNAISEDFKGGNLWPLASTAFVTVGTTTPSVSIDPVVPALKFNFVGGTDQGVSATARLGQFGLGNTALTMRFTATFLAGAPEQSRWLGVWIGSTPRDAPFEDELEPDTAEGYHFLIRRSGAKDIYKRTIGATSSVSLGAGVNSTNPHAPNAASNGTPIEFEIQITSTQVIIRNLVDGTASVFTDSTVRNNTSFISLRASSNPVMISNIKVSR